MEVTSDCHEIWTSFWYLWIENDSLVDEFNKIDEVIKPVVALQKRENLSYFHSKSNRKRLILEVSKESRNLHKFY